MSTKTKLKNSLTKLFEEELGPFFMALGKMAKAFFAEKAKRIAEHRIALELATTPAEKRKQKRLLNALALSIENEIIDLKVKISAKNREMVAKGIRIAISVLIASI